MNKTLIHAALITFFGIFTAHGATLLSLDNSNGFTVTIEPGLTLSRSNGGGNVTVGGGQFLGANGILIGTPTSSFQSVLQSSIFPDDGQSLVVGDVFQIESTSTGNIFDAEILFLSRPIDDLGAPPAGFSGTAGAAFEVSAVPEPSSALLAALGVIGLMFRRRA